MARQKTEHQIDRNNRYGRPSEWVAAAGVGLVSASTAFFRTVRSKFHEDANFREGFHALTASKNTDLAVENQLRINRAVEIFDTHLKGESSYDEFIEARTAINDALGITDKLDKPFCWSGSSEVIEAATPYRNKLTEFFKSLGDKVEKITHSEAFLKDTEKYIDRVSSIKKAHHQLVDQFADFIFGIRSKGVSGYIQGTWQRYRTASPASKHSIHYRTFAAFAAGAGVVAMITNQLNSRDKLNEIDKTTSDNARRINALLEREEARIEQPTPQNDHPHRGDVKPHGSKTASLLAERAANDDVAMDLAR